jgi:hypothetical protein
MNSYQILKNGEPMGIQGTFDYIVNAIRNLESNLDRTTQHSPFTVALVNTQAKITKNLVETTNTK